MPKRTTPARRGKSRMPVVIFGTGENGFQAFHILKHSREYQVIGFLDDDKAKHGTDVLGLPVFGDLGAIDKLRSRKGVRGGLVAIGNNRARGRLLPLMREAGLVAINAIHPQTFIDAPLKLGEGMIVEMGAAIHAGATVGDGVFMGGGSIVSHHSVVGDYVLIGGAVVFGGHINVGRYTLLGVGCSIQPQVTIGSNVIVGVGAAVIANLPDNVVAVGVPAKVIKQLSEPAS